MTSATEKLINTWINTAGLGLTRFESNQIISLASALQVAMMALIQCSYKPNHPMANSTEAIAMNARAEIEQICTGTEGAV